MKRWVLVCIFLTLGFPAFSHASQSGLVIYSFQVSGESAYDEFVSIKNESQSSLSLDGYSISRKTKAGTSWNTLYKFVGTLVAPGQEYVIAHDKYTGVSDFRYSTTSYSLTADNSIALLAPDKTIVDLVGYGEASSFEGSALPNPGAKEIYSRKDDQDNDNNASDFVSAQKSQVLDVNARNILITELMPNPEAGSEWIELYNPTNLSVSLSGYKLCDGMGRIHCFYFPNNELLAPREYKIYPQEVTKITLNNDGDWLEIRDSIDYSFADTGGNYGNADRGVSLSLFGSEYRWTGTPTPSAQNIYTDIFEVEKPVAGTTKKTAKKTVAKKASSLSKSSSSDTNVESDQPKDLVQSTSNENEAANSFAEIPLEQKILGIALLGFAVCLFLGYNLWDNKNYVKNLYNKISRRDH